MPVDVQAAPAAEEEEDVILACRYGDDEDVKNFVSHFGAHALIAAKDERGNTVLHMLCANGHDGTLHST